MLVHRRFHELDFGATAHRGLTLAGSTLLHLAAEYGSVDAARLVLDCGADVNGSAEVDANGAGGQTPIFHAAAQFDDYGLAVTELLIDRGADLSVKVKIRGHYDRPDEFVDATPLEVRDALSGRRRQRRNPEAAYISIFATVIVSPLSSPVTFT